MSTPPEGTVCAGERRRCSRPAVTMRQGRWLCDDCDERRRTGKRDAKRRKRQRQRPLDAQQAAERIRRQLPAVVAVMAELENPPACSPGDAINWVLDALDELGSELP